MILGTIGIITAFSAGYITILKMCGGDYEVTREENIRRYETHNKNTKKKKRDKVETYKRIDNHVFDK
jgi:hypothetical protein